MSRWREVSPPPGQVTELRDEDKVLARTVQGSVVVRAYVFEGKHRGESAALSDLRLAQEWCNERTAR